MKVLILVLLTLGAALGSFPLPTRDTKVEISIVQSKDAISLSPMDPSLVPTITSDLPMPKTSPAYFVNCKYGRANFQPLELINA